MARKKAKKPVAKKKPGYSKANGTSKRSFKKFTMGVING